MVVMQKTDEINNEDLEASNDFAEILGTTNIKIIEPV